MFYRKVITALREWAVEEERKPLILKGARQVGKTTAVDIFSKDFDHYISLNLEKKENAEIFERNLSLNYKGTGKGRASFRSCSVYQVFSLTYFF